MGINFAPILGIKTDISPYIPPDRAMLPLKGLKRAEPGRSAETPSNRTLRTK